PAPAFGYALSEHGVQHFSAFLSFRPLPHDAGITLERRQRFAPISPFRRLFEMKVIARFAARAGFEQGAGNVDHFGCVRAFIRERRAASGAETSDAATGLVLEARNVFAAFQDTEAALVTADIGDIGRAMRAAAGFGMVVPGPARRNVDLEFDRAANALAGRLHRRGFRAFRLHNR